MPYPSVSVHAADVHVLFVQVSEAAQAVPFDEIAKPLAAALGLSLVVERVVEFLKNLLDIPLRNPAASSLGRRATEKALAPIDELLEQHGREEELEALEARLEAHGGISAVRTRIEEIEADIERGEPGAARSSLEAELSELRAILDIGVDEIEWDERVPPSTVLTRPATDPDTGETVRAFVIQMAAFATGIIAAHVCNLRLFGHLLGGTAATIQPEWDALLSGLFIGGGSGPVHVLIRFISQRKIDVPADERQPAAVAAAARVASAEPAAARIVVAAPAPVTVERVENGESLPGNGGDRPPAAAPAAAEWVDLPYDGGVDVARLESVHRRRRDPDTVVYHHTAMHSGSRFQDVVNVIKARETNGHKWLTGYNCVVLADGSVHPFCRWDRYGNHAAGWNARSLGIAFNGNFEGSATDRWGNPDGRYGELRPTEPQLRAGARVIALWCHLYGIDASFYDSVDADFDGGIIPHKAVAQKSCPGSNFPYAELRRLVEYYVDGWRRSAEAQARIREFQLKPYVLA